MHDLLFQYERRSLCETGYDLGLSERCRCRCRCRGKSICRPYVGPSDMPGTRPRWQDGDCSQCLLRNHCWLESRTRKGGQYRASQLPLHPVQEVLVRRLCQPSEERSSTSRLRAIQICGIHFVRAYKCRLGSTSGFSEQSD
jgi:hypothetical protein